MQEHNCLDVVASKLPGQAVLEMTIELRRIQPCLRDQWQIYHGDARSSILPGMQPCATETPTVVSASLALVAVFCLTETLLQM